MRRIFLILPLIAGLALAACTFYQQTSRITAYKFGGKIFHVEDFTEEVADDDIDRTVTMWQVVDGERRFVGFYTADETPPEEDDIPAEGGHKRTILTVVQQGQNLGVVSTTKREIPGGGH